MKSIVVCLLCITLCLPILVSCNTNEVKNDLDYYENIGYRKTTNGYILSDIEKYSSAKLTVPDRLPDGMIVTGIIVDDFSKIEELYLSDSISFLLIYNDQLKKIHFGANTNESGALLAVQQQHLEEITVSASNSRYYAENNCIIERDTQTVVFGCKNSNIPHGVQEIGKMAFSNVPITSINIPESVTKIGISAFAYCTELKEVFIPKTVREIGACAFFATPDLLINCESESKPDGWDEEWIYTERAVKIGADSINWGVTREE